MSFRVAGTISPGIPPASPCSNLKFQQSSSRVPAQSSQAKIPFRPVHLATSFFHLTSVCPRDGTTTTTLLFIFALLAMPSLINRSDHPSKLKYRPSLWKQHSTSTMAESNGSLKVGNGNTHVNGVNGKMNGHAMNRRRVAGRNQSLLAWTFGAVARYVDIPELPELPLTSRVPRSRHRS